MLVGEVKRVRQRQSLNMRGVVGYESCLRLETVFANLATIGAKVVGDGAELVNRSHSFE